MKMYFEWDLIACFVVSHKVHVAGFGYIKAVFATLASFSIAHMGST